jgi:hypothetical protein
MKEIYIHGFRVKHEENEQAGIKYLLYDLDAQESKVFFNEARRNRYAEFEDDREGQFTLSYNSDGSFTLISRSGKIP